MDSLIEAKVINMVSRFCSVVPNWKQGSDIIIEMLYKTADDKIKSRLLLKLKRMSADNRFVVDGSLSDDLKEIYSTSDNEVKDSILDLIFYTNDDTIISSFRPIMSTALAEGGCGYLRATALRCFFKFSKKNSETITKICQQTSVDMDFNVRRAGIKCIRQLAEDRNSSFLDSLQIEEKIIFSNETILKFSRPELKSPAALIKLLSFDDDWEVKDKLDQVKIKLLRYYNLDIISSMVSLE